LCLSSYIEAVERLAAPDYIPTVDDVLRSRAKTTGIIETEFTVQGTVFKMVDVGGQRSERKKWMHCFTDVTALIFCIALSEYDLKLYEDNETNRMHESLKLFREICNSKWFIETSTILFLNKSDLFREKLASVSIKVAFPEYSGPDGDFDAAVKFITEQFVKLNESNRKQVYPHVTCATGTLRSRLVFLYIHFLIALSSSTDTNNVRVVFAAVKDIILNTALRRSGLTV
jgi:GTPase SAR1 family protein